MRGLGHVGGSRQRGQRARAEGAGGGRRQRARAEGAGGGRGQRARAEGAGRGRGAQTRANLHLKPSLCNSPNFYFSHSRKS